MAFDAMWTVAQVLQYTEVLREKYINKSNICSLGLTHPECCQLGGELVPLNEFTYSNAFMGCVMKNNYYKINFTGVSVSLVQWCYIIVLFHPWKGLRTSCDLDLWHVKPS